MNQSTLEHTMKKALGFTLMEIMLVVAIIGIVSALGIPAYMDYTTRARVTEGLELADAARTRIEIGLMEDRAPATNLLGDKPVDMVTGLTWNPGNPGDGRVGYILAEMDLPAKGKRKVLALELRDNGSWHCVTADGLAPANEVLEARYLPGSCRESHALSTTSTGYKVLKCKTGEDKVTAVDARGSSHDVCVPSCAADEKRDPANPSQCLANKPSTPGSGGISTTASAGAGKPSAAAGNTAGSTSTAGANPKGSFVPTAHPSDNNPCPAGQTFVPANQLYVNDPDHVPYKLGDPGSCVKDDTGHGTETVKCKVCTGNPLLCEHKHQTVECTWPNNLCINHFENSIIGRRTVRRYCGNHAEGDREWYHGTSDMDKCMTFDPTMVLTLEFECTFACYTDNCNLSLKPDESTLWVPE
jgi:type IV pilus assembly protein PilA